MRNVTAVIFIFLMFSGIQAAAGQHRPMKEMNGDCKNYKLNVSHMLSEAKKDAISTPASSVHFFEVPELNQGKWVELLLQEDSKEQGIDWLVKPVMNAGFVGNYGGIASFTPVKSGKYFIAANSKIWLEVINAETKNVVRAGSFEMQMKCSDVFKVVTGFELLEGQRYLVQVSGGKKSASRFFVDSTDVL